MLKAKRFTSFDGAQYYMQSCTMEELNRLVAYERKRWEDAGKPEAPEGFPRMDEIEMTESEYGAVPATNESYEVFCKGGE